MQALRILAGREAREQIAREGLVADDFDVLVGASGGPKWFSLYGLDQYLIKEYFRQREQPLHLLGTSAGAFRFACYATADAAEASARFCSTYRQLRYPPGSSVDEVTRISAQILDAIFADPASVDAVLDNRVFKLNLIVSRARHLNASPRRWVQAAGLGMAAGLNLFSRNTLSWSFERVLFHHPQATPPFIGANNLRTRTVALSRDNLKAAVMASGSIPMALKGVSDIPGAGAGIYYDGGVTDYHFDLPFNSKRLVLYPHFYPHTIPGWFDKPLKRRHNSGDQRRVVRLCPSSEFVASLPYGKIPDRKDFQKMDDETRIRYWQQAVDASHRLAEAFDRHHHRQDWESLLEPLD